MLVSDFSQQLRESIKQSKKLILVTPEASTIDAVHAMMAWRNELKRRDKEIRIVKHKLDKESNRFLPYVDEIESELPVQRTTVKVGLNGNGVKKMSYEIKDQAFYIYLTPKTGIINADQIEVVIEQLDSEILMTFGLSDPSDLKDWPARWSEEAKSSQTLINIDIKEENLRYGSLNIIDPTKTSLSQLTAGLFQQLGWELDPETATILVNGIAAATGHFAKNVNADVFEIVSQLMKAGGKLSDRGIISS